MILIVGGLASGKRTFARSLGFSDADMDDGELGSAPVLLNAQNLIAFGCDDALDGKGELPEGLVDELLCREVVTCLEVGSGVVPLDRDARIWRERAGHLANALAQRADRVVRMVCGIPVDLK